MEPNQTNNKCCSSQLRYDEISRDWVVIAPGRGKRPGEYRRQRIHIQMDLSKCPFCNLNHESEFLMGFAHGKKVTGTLPSDWTLAVIQNKFPAFCPITGDKICKQKIGPLYNSMDAVGFCEVVVTRSHENHIGMMNVASVKEIIDAYQARYLELKKNKFVKYISIFHNHGVEAGASQPHPHSQIITSPLIDVDLNNALENSKKYFHQHKKCLSCEMTAWERKDEVRVICENRDFIASCPFAPKTAFQVIITPRFHSPHFESITEGQKKNLAEIFSIAIKKICKAMGDPAYNFYLHTAPVDSKDYSYYHWHFTIMPRTAVFAGFELGSRIEISTITPEAAAEYLRNQEV